MMNEKEVETLLKETKAILEGHFLSDQRPPQPALCRKIQRSPAS